MEPEDTAGVEPEQQKCCGVNGRAVTAAVITRILFMSHVTLSAWRAVTVNNGNLYWFILMGVVLLQIIEMIVILVKRRGHEWNHFCWAVLLYLLGVVPCVWTIEINRLNILNNNNATIANTSTLYGLSYELRLTDTEWAIAIEQMMMCFLILGRWLLPKGEITRDQLSQVLLVYLGLAADIVELFEIFQEETVIADPDFVIVILGTYTWSLWQFTFIIIPSNIEDLPQSKQAQIMAANKAILGKNSTTGPDDENQGCCKTCGNNPFCQAEIFAILATMIFQDGPFFGLRLCAIVLYGVSSYTNYFFIVKNCLFLVLQTYRMMIIVCPCCEKTNDDENTVTEPVKTNKIVPIESNGTENRNSFSASITPPVTDFVKKSDF